MLIMFKFVVFGFLITVLFYNNCSSIRYGDARATYVNICSGSNYTLNAEYTIRNHSDGQSARGTLYQTEDFGNDNKYSCKIFSKRGKKNKLLIEIAGTGACDALNKYGRQLWWDLEKEAGMETPGVCPIKKRTWTLDWHKIRFTEVPQMVLVPNGRYHVDCKLFDIQGKLIKACGSGDGFKTS